MTPPTTVRALLAAAGIPADDAEVAGLVAGYPGLRAMIESLYALPAARHAPSALHFTPSAAADRWP